jgi:MoaA/NifB/PqqE/SkfB family radical SAM enzyme
MNIEQLIIPPKTLALAATYRCTATCKNCCFGCSPEMKKRLSLIEMKRYVDQAVTFYGDSLKVLVITGGECFLLKDDLAKIIAVYITREM